LNHRFLVALAALIALAVGPLQLHAAADGLRIVRTHRPAITSRSYAAIWRGSIRSASINNGGWCSGGTAAVVKRKASI
jgi:hypothetical protein